METVKLNTLPEEVLRTLPTFYQTHTETEKKVHCMICTPDKSWCWYIVEGQKTKYGWELFGFINSNIDEPFSEWCCELLEELTEEVEVEYHIPYNMYIDNNGSLIYK